MAFGAEADGAEEGLGPIAAFRSRRPPEAARGKLSARPATVLVAMAAAVLASILAAGCGAARQDAHEPRAVFTMRVVRASFPARQWVAKPTALELRVRNTGVHTAPNVAITLDSFYYTESYPELAASKRPVWVIERGPGAIAAPPVESQAISPPGGGQTAYVNTWAFGSLPPGRARTFRWLVAPVKPGLHTVGFTVAPSLAGKARAQLASGAPVHGRFLVHIAPAPPARHVNPNTGQVVPGPYPSVR